MHTPAHIDDATTNSSQAARRNLLTLARLFAIAVLLAAGMTVSLSLTQANRSATVCACGLGNTVTMVANNAPALAYAPPEVATDAPAGIFALDYEANKPIALYEDLSRSPSAPDPTSVQWRWNFGDGSPVSYDVKPTHTYTAPGTYTIVVSVYEPVSNTWGIFDNAIMHVISAAYTSPPAAQARALTPAVIGVGGQITFDATGSHAVTGSTATYAWNFGDNSVATGTQVTHQFKQAGRGFVTLTVTDARGAKSIAQVSVVIIETAQPAKVTVSPASAPVGTTVNFDASQTTPPADAPVAVAWDFGDGSPLVTTTTPTVSHTYTKPGAYKVTAGVYGQLGDGGVTTIPVTALAAAGSTPTANSGGVNWLLLGGGVVALLTLAGGVWYWLDQRKRAALERERQQARELAHARRVNGGQPRRRPDQRQPYPPDRSERRR